MGSYFLGVESTSLAIHLGSYLFDKAGLSCSWSAGEQIDLLYSPLPQQANYRTGVFSVFPFASSFFALRRCLNSATLFDLFIFLHNVT